VDRKWTTCRQNGEFDASRTRRGRAKIEANERTCDIFPLAEGRNSLDWVLAGSIAANACAWPASPAGSGSDRQ
jgi:hypothetical protein